MAWWARDVFLLPLLLLDGIVAWGGRGGVVSMPAAVVGKARVGRRVMEKAREYVLTSLE
jgi:hypothetical protein